ncbi:F0F1 ATP synthase subunit delta [Alkalihalobacillus sp. LMS39]|uniref:F0F1 ATP synthase subunit delta n=1 Tax=Alkalihalobacillus sp. LMS39 TaxID=2924032 RepID=UPI001FB3668C|nr:F0F1 ATP synthase subunit delta [Alkalihalobacillus sp. LMS39]UOE93943.1 F0F1 ATP synthase subunit delta [Alkalihalobacillus sp. LMS39]
MSNKAVANRYAVALFQLAKEKGLVQQIETELQLVKEVVGNTPEMMTVLLNPKVRVEEKQNIVKTGFGQNVSELVMHTLLLLVERKRVEALVPLVDEYKLLSYQEQNVAEAKVYSAYPLSEQEKTDLSVLFAQKVGKSKLIIENIIDKNLIAGITIRIGDRIYDGSVKGQLTRLERNLLQKS